jgi:hypothetical protein
VRIRRGRREHFVRPTETPCNVCVAIQATSAFSNELLARVFNSNTVGLAVVWVLLSFYLFILRPLFAFLQAVGRIPLCLMRTK